MPSYLIALSTGYGRTLSVEEGLRRPELRLVRDAGGERGQASVAADPEFTKRSHRQTEAPWFVPVDRGAPQRALLPIRVCEPHEEHASAVRRPVLEFDSLPWICGNEVGCAAISS